MGGFPRGGSSPLRRITKGPRIRAFRRSRADAALRSRTPRDIFATSVEDVTGADHCGGERRNPSDKVASWPANIPASTPTKRSKERATATTSATPTASCPVSAAFGPPQAAVIDKAGLKVQAAAGTLHLNTARFEDHFESWLAGHKPLVEPGTCAICGVSRASRRRCGLGRLGRRHAMDGCAAPCSTTPSPTAMSPPRTEHSGCGDLLGGDDQLLPATADEAVLRSVVEDVVGGHVR